MKALLVLVLLVFSVSAYGTSLDIAVEDLRLNYAEGIKAGPGKFNDYWARDGFFASYGALAIGDTEIVKQNLELFIENQRIGQIPIRVGNTHMFWRLLGFNFNDHKPKYSNDKSKSPAVDPNCLFVISANEYISVTNDAAFAGSNYGSFVDAIKWLLLQDTDGDYLIEEKHYANWKDSVKKNGKVLYSNVCWFSAVNSLKEISLKLGKNNDYERYNNLSILIKNKINEEFWNGEYYIDWIDDEEHDFFDSDANLLAIVWGVADTDQSVQILEYIDEKGLFTFTMPAVFPEYPRNKQSLLLRMGGMGDYHTKMQWLWIGALEVLARHKAGQQDIALEHLSQISEKINEYQQVYEVYELNGKPVNRWLYNSEEHFAWSAGMYLHALYEVNGL